MVLLQLILLIAGFLLFLLAAGGVASARFNLTDAGLACWILSVILGMAGAGLR